MLVREKKVRLVNFERKVFDVKNEPMPKGEWWYWFWLFFFDNKKDPSKPRQLMIVWSIKNEREIESNDLKFRFRPSKDRKNFDGVIASWYFDGKRMHHGFILEKSKIKISGRELLTESAVPTSFSVGKNQNTIRIGKDFHLVADMEDNGFNNEFYRLDIAKKGYSMIELKRMNLTGKVKNERIHGTAFFQRVFFNMPYPSWYWGVFHFENKNILIYTNSFLFGKSFSKRISFFDGKKTHYFDNMRIEKTGKNKLTFKMSAENEDEKIRFTIKSYSHTCWAFKKKSLRLIPSTLIYNEYPATVSDFELTNKRTGARIVLKELGKSVGNAEYGNGLLL